eukprot:maker-scaffold_4-snap-gene-5.65-mRNA-1 protein AED:0.01 eAED:0.01 QI:121/1/1/1/1/1/2/108/444
MTAQSNEATSFAELCLHEELLKACENLNWKTPTPIQAQSIPLALKGKDVIGLAETGSGKTGAFSLPLLNSLISNPSPFFGLILAPTRELAFQINEVITALGASIGTRSVCIVGGVDMVSQSISLNKRPHIIVGTPGRIVDHLENTKGFTLRNLKVLILDEADRLLNMDFEEAINNILEVIPKERQSFLFSATMTKKVSKLQRASLKDPVKVAIQDENDGDESKFQTAKGLIQSYCFIPAKFKEIYLAFLLQTGDFQSKNGLIFVSTCAEAEKLALALNHLKDEFNLLEVVPLHGQMIQSKRLAALTKFKAGGRILIATDVASRGLDIPLVDWVINYDVPANAKEYVHRVGRTARAGKSGVATTMVTQYDIELIQKVEKILGFKLEENVNLKRMSKEEKREMVAENGDVVSQALKFATTEMKVNEEKGKKRKFGGGGKRRKQRRR